MNKPHKYNVEQKKLETKKKKYCVTPFIQSSKPGKTNLWLTSDSGYLRK